MANEECPICGIKVKEANMSNHLKRVHPSSESAGALARAAERDMRKRSPHAPMTSGAKKMVLAMVIVSIVVASTGLLYSWYMGLDHPRIDVTPSTYDFGDVSQTISTATFQVWNVGKADLKLTGASTSCGCTSAVFRIGGLSSPTFGMHNNPKGWSATLYPGESAILEVSYDAGLHPDAGHVQRAVYVNSNDPFTPEFQIDLTANVIL